MERNGKERKRLDRVEKQSEAREGKGKEGVERSGWGRRGEDSTG